MSLKEGNLMKKILLIGDSIRKGYDKYVKIAFEDVANVYYPQDNCRFAANVTRDLIWWKEYHKIPDDIDLVHWNAGLWDDLILLDGERLTPLPVYSYYIERICKMISLLFLKAKVIFATSTFVIERLFVDNKRYNADTRTYNAAAVEIVKKYGAEINDLYSVTENMPESYFSDMSHPYTKEGTRLLTEKVVSAIEKALDIRGKVLDYDTLFEEQKNILGN